MLYGTINGVLGVVASLPAAQYAALEGLQAAMRKVVRGVGGLDHAQVRLRLQCAGGGSVCRAGCDAGVGVEWLEDQVERAPSCCVLKEEGSGRRFPTPHARTVRRLPRPSG